MVRWKCASALLLTLATAGCHMCQSYTDCTPVVIDGPYSHVSGRAGSILSSTPTPLPGVTTALPEPVEVEPTPMN